MNVAQQLLPLASGIVFFAVFYAVFVYVFFIHTPARAVRAQAVRAAVDDRDGIDQDTP